MVAIGVGGVHLRGAVEPGISLGRSIKRISSSNVELRALCIYPVTPALGLQDIFTSSHLVPEEAEGAEAFIASLAAIKDKHGLDYIVPGLDADVMQVASVKQTLDEMGVQSLIPELSSVEASCKIKLSKHSEELPFPYARSQVISQYDDLKNLALPIVLKGSVTDSYIVKDPSDAEVAFERIEQIWGMPAVSQEFLFGEEYSVCAIAGPKPGEIAGSVMVKKIGVTEKGNTWLAQFIDNDEISAIAQQVVSYLNWLGPIEIEMRYVNTRGFVVFEINPRFPGWVSWMDWDAYGMIHLFLDLLFGLTPKQVETKSGTIGVRNNSYITFPIDRMMRLAGQKYV